ncbi:S1 RNA-binding domain-containing protein [Silvibacterium dinghuense]|uniref:Small ribosomal subunit protein bS1 n=1 Tax=Silvibacterium dinghuense TaxID=1560006 RepID=A0A4Q1SGX3_9BACT|nr:S1 RNA-binding domain-containing protein [Silvibacterium dinghuense]RXS96410.1 S1 RNA-binding domain-containing protein [Silvibacterium dinghuense]GGG90552.1 30S ribosomal protein S1 [Silvibacterium dinghuense]
MNSESVPSIPSSEASLNPETAETSSVAAESFGEVLSQFEGENRLAGKDRSEMEGIVVSITPELVVLDIGLKVEGALPRTAFENDAAEVKVGDRFPVSVKGRTEEGYYDLSRKKVARVTDWSSLEEAFANKTSVVGVVTAANKGGLTVDIGVRAFLPASRSGARDAESLEKLVGQEIRCRITKLDVAEEDVVVDRRAVLEEEAAEARAGRFAALGEGSIVTGTVRTLAPYGAFLDLGGVDGLLHISDLAWTRVEKLEDLLTVGQELEVVVLKIDGESNRISLGRKQLTAQPWDTAAERYIAGQKVSGTVRRLTDFGAFVEVEPGIEGLIHVSEMSWIKRVRKPSNVLKVGDTVDAIILGLQSQERKLSLGLKQVLDNPWAAVQQKYPAGTVIKGSVVRLVPFGAFVEIEPGIEGLVHVSEIVADKRIAHPQDVLRVGEVVTAQVMAVDAEKRQVKLSMKQLIPTGLDEYLAEHAVGNVVSGRVADAGDGSAKVELGEGVFAMCRGAAPANTAENSEAAGAANLSSLTAMLQARWKGSVKAPATDTGLKVGQVRSFRITVLDAAQKRVEVEPA